jgi:MFS family permease
LIGTFALNFPLFISAMTVKVFHAGAGRYGLAMSIMAVGSVAGAIFSAVPLRAGMGHLAIGAALLGLGFVLAALAPTYWPFTAALVLMGAAAVMFTTLTNSVMQLETEPFMRGRVLALRVAVAVGATPLGAPLVGWIADGPGPRLALAVGGAASLAAVLVALRHVVAVPRPAPALSGAIRPESDCGDINCPP